MGGDQRLAGQTVVVIGGSTGIGFETARRAREEGAEVIVTARDPGRVQRAGLELDGSIAAFDATDFPRLARFFAALPTPVDHVLVSGPGHPEVSLAELDVDGARRELEAHLLLPLQVARASAAVVRPPGTLLFIGCTDRHQSMANVAFISAITAALSAMAKALASQLAPIRVNVITTGFVDSKGSAATLGESVRMRREQLESTLPIRRVVSPADVAALAIHLMSNTAITGGTFEIDGGQQLVDH